MVGWDGDRGRVIGTIIVTAGIGPMIALTLRWFDLLYAHESEARHDANIGHVWGLELHDELEGDLPSLTSSGR